MHVIGEINEVLAARLQRLSTILFNNQRADGRIQIDAIVAEFGDVNHDLLRQSLRKLDDKALINFDGQTHVELYGLGKYLYERGCIPEFVLGFEYIDQKYRDAVIRIVVVKSNGDPAAGTGFFINDFPNCVVTNRHVAEHVITQLEYRNNEVFHQGDCERLIGPPELDLAIIRCPVPANVQPLRVAWESEFLGPLAEVLVLGYPVVAGLLPGLHHGRGKIGMIGETFTKEKSLVLSELTDAGGSGGPVINVEGMVVGVVAQRHIVLAEEHPQTNFVNAIPIEYMRRLPL